MERKSVAQECCCPVLRGFHSSGQNENMCTAKQLMRSKISSKASCGLLIPENPMFVPHVFSVKSNFWGIHTPQIRQIHVYHVCTPNNSGNPGTTNQALNRTTCDRRMVDWTLLVVKYGDKAITVWTTSSIQELSWYQKKTGICMDFKSFKISKHGLSCYNQQECLSAGYRATNMHIYIYIDR